MLSLGFRLMVYLGYNSCSIIEVPTMCQLAYLVFDIIRLVRNVRSLFVFNYVYMCVNGVGTRAHMNVILSEARQGY